MSTSFVAQAVGAALMGATVGFAAFVLGVGYVGNVALVLIAFGPPLLVWLMYRSRGDQLMAMSLVSVAAALAVCLLGAASYSS